MSPTCIVYAIPPRRIRPKPHADELPGPWIVTTHKPASKPRHKPPEPVSRVVYAPPQRQRDAWRRYLAMTGQEELQEP